jgi:hypothetical protein
MPAASSMTVAQLRKALEERGLDTSGLKAALVERYQEALDNSAGGEDDSAPAAEAEAAPEAAAPPAADDAAMGDAAKDDDAVSLDGGDDLGPAPEVDAPAEPKGNSKDSAPAEAKAKAPEKPSDGINRGLTCAICREKGHLKADCPNAGKDGFPTAAELDANVFCFICGERGHRSRLCPSRIPDDKLPKGACAICADTSHRMYACPKKKLDPDAKCSICQKTGHERRDCPDAPPVDHSKTFCFICGEKGHRRVDCPKALTGDAVPENGCVICGSAEHSMHRCPQKKVDPDAPPPKERQRKRERSRERDGGGGGNKSRRRDDSRDRGRRRRDDSRDGRGYRGGGGDYMRRDEYRGGGSYGKPVCRDFLAGRCRFDDCKYSHEGRPRDDRDRGGYGGGFRSDREPARDRGDEICRDYQRGRCSRPGCRFKHVGAPGGQGKEPPNRDQRPGSASPEKRRSP